jgi:FkbM family methyltransferase
MRSVEQVDGWYWPAGDTEARHLIPAEAARDIPFLMAHVPGRQRIVQAGGNTGWWARILAAEFAEVLTFEPDPTNYACLLLNDLPKNVRSVHGALWHAAGWLSLDDPGNNCGAIQVTTGATGATRAMAIDDFHLDACDAICLDVEGSELPALQGAEATISRFQPTIITEEKGLGRALGCEDGAVGTWLAALSYRRVATAGRDVVYRV